MAELPGRLTEPSRGRLAAVLGKPIAHCLSPVLHRAAYAGLGLVDWHYAAIECAEADLPAVLAEHPDAAGFSCTMPLKQAVLRVAGSASPMASAIGAGNTLLPTSDGWHAENTDWIGVRDALAERDLRPHRVVVLGAGGTARAALAALPGASEVTVLVRSPARADELLAAAERLTAAGLLSARVRVRRLGDPVPADLLISTLPPGAADPLLSELPIGAGCAVLDAVYAGWPTALARAALRAGAPVLSGAGMLLHQAARQVELMTGHAAPVAAMRAAMLAAAPDCGC